MASRIVPEGGWSSRLKPERTPRVKNRSHLDFIKALPCICCLAGGKVVQADDPMHLSSASHEHGKPDETGGSRKSDDRWALPGCRRHHEQQHARNEMKFWRSYGIDPHLLALVLWGLTCDDHAALQVLQLHANQSRQRRAIQGEANV